MSEPKHVKTWVGPLVKVIFMRFLSNKHNKPYSDISPKDMTDSEIELWKEVEAMNGNIVGISFKNRLH
jgi:hypothetical protein|tara:strand:- start:87 stop:290 length:204 start_codon:yes stop_codon:yes gene_type:complete